MAEEIEPLCPHGADGGAYCPKDQCPVLVAPDDVLQALAATKPLQGTLGESAKRHAIAEIQRRLRTRSWRCLCC
jgi:hypothetical protein